MSSSLRQGGEEVPDHVEEAGVSGRIGPGRAPDGSVAHGDDPVDELSPFQALEGALAAPIEGRHQDPGHKGCLSRAGNPAHRVERAQTKSQIHVAQVPEPHTTESELGAVAGPAARRDRDTLSAAKGCPGRRSRRGVLIGTEPLLWWTGVEDPSPLGARARAHIHQPVCSANQGLVVFHEDDGVAVVPQLVQHLGEADAVHRMQAD